MKIKIILALIVEMITATFLLFVLSIFIEKIFSIEMNNFMFVLLPSLMLLWVQVIWIKSEPKGWLNMMEKIFGVKISAE